jgi:hypothetical protein
MSIDIRSALSNGLDRTLKRNGAILFVVFLVFGIVSVVAVQSVLETILPQTLHLLQETTQRQLSSQFVQLMERPQPLAVSIPVGSAIALFLVVFVLGQTARVLSDRTFISDESERLYEPRRWIVPATLSSIGGVLIFFLLLVLLYLPIGFFMLLSPLLGALSASIAVVVAIVLGISFFFFRQEIASEDIGPIDALTDSWSLVRGNRLTVFGLSVLLYIISFVSSTIASILFSLFSPSAGVIASVVIGAALLVFDSAVAAQAYQQLQAEKRDTDSVDTDTTGDEDDEWESDDEWNDPPL